MGGQILVLAIELFVNQTVSVWLAPVSYTHLDVYKRQERFTLGITDDVTFLSLPEVKPAPITAAAGTKECKMCIRDR